MATLPGWAVSIRAHAVQTVRRVGGARKLFYAVSIVFPAVLIGTGLTGWLVVATTQRSSNGPTSEAGTSQSDEAEVNMSPVVPCTEPSTTAVADKKETSPTTEPTTQPTTTAPTPTSSSTPKPSSGSSSPKPSAPSGGGTPAPAETLTATVAIYGDSQSDTDAEDLNHQRVVNYIMQTAASTVFHAGDLLEDGTQASLDRFNAVTATMCSTRAFYSAQGNNERNSPVYFNNFEYPGNEHWFSVNVGNLHMVILDNYASSVAVGSEQYNWLAADLQTAASQSRATGVIFHYPVYGVGGDHKGMIPTMVPLFRQYGVDFVISGHEHAYQRKIVDGITYFVTSGQPSLGYITAKIYSTNKVVFSAYNSSNAVIDTVTVNPR